jgi:S1-C subfamily serine protease
MIGDVDEQWRLNNDLAAKSGVLIRQVLEGGPAKQAGLRPGDILLAVDETPVGPMNLRALLTKIGAGVRVELSVIRDGEHLAMSLTLGRRP